MYIGLGQVDGAESLLESMPAYGSPCVMSAGGWADGCAATGPNGPDRFNLICAEFYGPNCVAAAPAYEYPSDVWPQPQAAGVDAGVPCQYSAFGSTPCSPAETDTGTEITTTTAPSQQAPTVAPSQILASTTAASTVPASTTAASTAAASTTAASTTAANALIPASISGMSTTTLLILAALGVGVVLLLGSD